MNVAEFPIYQTMIRLYGLNGQNIGLL